MYCIVGLGTSLLLLFFPVFVRFSFHTLIDDIFVKDFCRTAQARVVIFGMQVDNDEMYCQIPNQPSHAYPSLYLSNFLPFHISNNNFFCQRLL